MSRSDPPRSSTAAKSPRSELAEEPSEANGRRAPSPGRRLNLRFAAFVRWLHIYLSMFGLAAIVFFSVTGITLNHPDWFQTATERTVQLKGQVDLKWLKPGSAEVAKLEVVEHLRSAHGVRGALAEFTTDDRECVVTFKGPGYAADAFIDRESGRYTLSETRHGLVAVINDLHKGRDTGRAWSLVIDLSAALMTVAALSGLLLLFYIKRRRVSGLVIALVGTALIVAVVVLGVP